MKKILILSYFFPPCNLTASQRSYGWAKYLNRFGYYPVIVTRNWDNQIKLPSDVLKSSGYETIIKYESGYEVHQVPYYASMRDMMSQEKCANVFQVFLRKMLTFIELIGQNFSNKVIPFKNLYSYADTLLKTEKEIDCLIVTANPFAMFRFGYLLSKKHRLPWIADYRDDWSTSEINNNNGFLNNIVRYFDTKSEKKWVKSASVFTTISPYYKEKISKFLSLEGEVVLNGFFEEDFKSEKLLDGQSCFVIIYNGTLYSSQKIEPFIQAVNKVIDSIKGDKEFVVKFLGLDFDPIQSRRVKDLIKGYEKNYVITGRMPRADVLDQQRKAHLLLMVGHKGVKGIPSSKLYEYLALRKPILLCGSDKDILSETVGGYNLGVIADSASEIANTLNKELERFYSGEEQSRIADEMYVTNYTRLNQTEKLSKVINSVVNGV